MAADKENRKAGSSRSESPDRDSENSGSARRDLVPVNTAATDKPSTRSRLADSLFVAHLFATRFQEPQTREKRRADPADANASYRKGAKRPARTGRYLSKKV